MIVSKLSRMLGERRMNMTELAEQAGVSRKTISRWYNDQAQYVNLGALSKVCAALKCQPGDIFKFVDNE